MELVCKYKTMKIFLIFRFFHCIWFIDSENLSFILNMKKNDRALTFSTSHSHNLKKRLPLIAPHFTVSKYIN